MVNSVEHIAEQLFKVIKGFGHQIVLFTDDGKKTTDPEEARRFYAKNLQMMVNYVVDETTNEIVINLSSHTDIKSVKPMLAAIRNLANRYIIEYTVKTFGKSIEPRDFAFMAKNKVEEGFSGWHGSARKSVNELGNARIIVKHKRSVDEEKRGARTRQIESIFIENAEGERFKFPSTNITAAKAMARHVQEGGAPFDDFGQHIYGIMEELNQLKKFSRKNKRNDFFEDAQIGEEITAHIGNLRGSLKSMSTTRGYAAQMESFTIESEDVSQERIDELKDATTMSYFDETIADSLPYVARVIEGFRKRQDLEKQVADLARYVIKNKDNITLNREIDFDDPESPSARKFRDPATEIAATVDFIAPAVADDQLSNLLMIMSDAVHDLDGKYLNMAMQALNVIKRSATVAESNHIDEEKVDVEESEISKISESMDKYNVRKIFGV